MDAVTGEDGFEQSGLRGIVVDGGFEHPEEFEQFGGELARPALGANVVERRGFLARAFLDAVFQPRLHHLQPRHFKCENLLRDGRELAVADVERAGGVVVVEGFGIAVGVAGDGFGASRRAVRHLPAFVAFGHVALAVGVQPE